MGQGGHRVHPCITLLLSVFFYQRERRVEEGPMGEGGHHLRLSMTLLLPVFLFQGESRVEDGLMGEGGHRLHLSYFTCFCLPFPRREDGGGWTDG